MRHPFRELFCRMSALLAAGLVLTTVLQGQAPEIAFDSSADFLKLPDGIYFGEVAGIATNSKGHAFVYARGGTTLASTGGSRTFTSGGSRLFEFDQTGKFLRELALGMYGLLFAEGVRVDAQDNIWLVDRGSNLVIKLNSEGRVSMVLGRKPEAAPAPGRGGGGGTGRGGVPGAGVAGDNFNGPTDIAWDTTGNIFVSDGYGNARIAKFDRNGAFIKSWGQKGKEAGQFDTPHSIALDASNNVYVADPGNRRIQVFDTDGNFKSLISNIGAPRAICISPQPPQFLFSSNSNDPAGYEDGEIYKLELDGKLVGRFGRAGTKIKQFGTVNAIDCRRPNELHVGELINWRVQKLTLR